MTGLVGMILQSLLAERTSFAERENGDLTAIKELATQLTRDTLKGMGAAASGNGVTTVGAEKVRQIEAAK